MKLSSPLCPPPGIRFTIVSSMMPSPKKTDSMMPIAVSSLTRLCARIAVTAHAPSSALAAAPSSMTGRLLNPSIAKPMTTPGSAACASASLIRLCRFQ